MHEEVPPVHIASLDSPLIELAGISLRGRVRSPNEDCFITSELRRSLVLGASSLPVCEGTPWFGCCQGKLLAVAGGNGAGSTQLASMLAMRVLAGYATAVMPWIVDHDDEDEERLHDELINAMQQCSRQIRREADRVGVGSAPVMVTAAYIVWPMLLSVHAGRGRAYLERRGELVRLTSDGPGVGGVSSARGVELDVSRASLRRGDRVLLCSEGLVRHVDEREIPDILSRADTASASCRALVEAGHERGGDHDVTVALAQISES